MNLLRETMRRIMPLISVALSLMPLASLAEGDCKVRSSEERIVMLLADVQRNAEIKKDDMAVLKSFLPILSQNGDDLLIRTQFLNVKGGAVTPDFACRRLTTRKLATAYDGIEGKYAVNYPANSPLYRVASRLDADFEDMMLSLGSMEVTAEMNKIAIIFGNLDYYIENSTEGASSAGYYLSDGWLKSPISPFVRNVTQSESSRFVGTKVIVISDGKEPLSVRRGKEEFFAMLFGLLGGELYYYGPSYANIGAKSGVLDKVLAQVIDGSRAPIEPRSIGEPQLLQFINRKDSRNITREDLQ